MSTASGRARGRGRGRVGSSVESDLLALALGAGCSSDESSDDAAGALHRDQPPSGSTGVGGCYSAPAGPAFHSSSTPILTQWAVVANAVVAVVVRSGMCDTRGKALAILVFGGADRTGELLSTLRDTVQVGRAVARCGTGAGCTADSEGS